MSTPRSRLALCLALVVTLTAVVAPTALAGDSTRHDVVAFPDPRDDTPHAHDGIVFAIAQVGDVVVVGGTFQEVSQGRYSTRWEQPYVFAFDRQTGQLRASFRPQLDGTVEALEAGPGGTSVFVGGRFNHVNGEPRSGLVRLDLDGEVVSSFPTTVNDAVLDLELAGGVLWAGGNFTEIGGTDIASFAAIDPNTGAVDQTVNLEFAGPVSTPKVEGTLAVQKVAPVDDGGRVLVAGNFTSVGGRTRHRIALLDTSMRPAVVSDWRTDVYAPLCDEELSPQYVTDVDVSPDGTYAVVSTKKRPNPDNLCSTIARFELFDESPGQVPTWVAHSGGDSLTGVMTTGEAIYVGGHQRWMNNPFGRDSERSGAVPTPGFSVLDPRNGLPLDVPVERVPRVDGIFALHGTSTDVWLGYDSEFINDEFHGRLASLPLAGGDPIPRPGAGTLPGLLLAADGPDTTTREADTDHLGSPTPAATGGINWTTVGGATQVGDVLYTARSDGKLHAGSFDGANYDDDRVLELYGLDAFHFRLDTVTSLAFDPVRSRLYYTLEDDPGLHWRAFTPQSEVVGAEAFVAAADLGLENATGAFVVGDHVFVARDDRLDRFRLDADGAVVPGSRQVIGQLPVDGPGTASSLLVLGGDPPDNLRPLADLRVRCVAGRCVLDAAGAHDPDGSLVAWDFSVDGTPIPSDGRLAEWTAPASGSHTFSVEVTDDDGATDVASRTALVDVPTGVQRVFGDDRVATAVAASQLTHPDGAQTVYVATANDYPDALAAGPAAARDAAPILLTRGDELPELLHEELVRLAPHRIVVLGGEGVVPATIGEQLADLADVVDRIGGDDRFETAALVARTFGDSVDDVTIATGADFPDALTGGALSARADAPVLLVRPNTLPNDVKILLREIRPERATVFGGAAVVSDGVVTELGDFVPHVSRTFGDDRYATGAAVAGSFDPADTEVVVIATGADFPDALAGVPVAAAAGGPVLLVSPDRVPDVVAAELDRLGPRWIVVLGGPGAVSDEVVQALGVHVVPPS